MQIVLEKAEYVKLKTDRLALAFVADVRKIINSTDDLRDTKFTSIQERLKSHDAASAKLKKDDVV